MPSVYLLPNEYSTYGLPSTTTDAEIIEASAIIDGYLNRPDGLIYTTSDTMEATGLPIFEIKNANFKRTIMLNFKPLIKIIQLEYSAMPCAGLPIFNVLTGNVLLENGTVFLNNPAPPYALIKVQYLAGFLKISITFKRKTSLRKYCCHYSRWCHFGISF